jgi:hypothetical protein
MSSKSRPKPQYGKGIEAKRAQVVKTRPELEPFAGSTSAEHWAYLRLAELIGPQNMNTRALRILVARLPKEFPGQAVKCERGLIRLWAGCVHYLIKHEHLLRQMPVALHGIASDDIPSALGCAKPPQDPFHVRMALPPVETLLAGIGHKFGWIFPPLPDA